MLHLPERQHVHPLCSLPHFLALPGTKLALPLAQRTAAALPPLETAAVQGVLVLLTWNPAGYCATSVRPGLSLAGWWGRTV